LKRVPRELKLDIKAHDDPNDNPRANRLIANRRERGSFDAQTALFGALLVVFASAAYLHDRWTVVAYTAAVIFVIPALLLVRRALKHRNPV
jgi:hypothetical protein